MLILLKLYIIITTTNELWHTNIFSAFPGMCQAGLPLFYFKIHLLYISRSGFQMYFGGRRMSTMSSYSDLFHARLMSSHSWKQHCNQIFLDGCHWHCPETRFLAVAKSYGGQFRSIWEHCLLYSNGSTDGNVNKSIEICLTHMVRGSPSRHT